MPLGSATSPSSGLAHHVGRCRRLLPTDDSDRIGVFLIPTFYLLFRLLDSEGPELADSSAPSDYVNSTAVPLSPSGNYDPLWDKWLDG